MPFPVIVFTDSRHKWGGVSTKILSLASGLEKRGYEVHIFARKNGVNIGRYQKNLNHVHPFYYGPDFNPAAIIKFLFLFKKFKITHVFTNVQKEITTAAVAARFLKLKNIRFIGLPTDIQGKRSDINALKKYADIIHMPSDFIKGSLIHAYQWFPKEKAIVIPNGVIDLMLGFEERDRLRNNFGYSPDDIVIGYVGQFSPMKRVPWVLNQLLPLLFKYNKIKILLVGSGETQDEVRQIVRTNRLEKRVVFTGYVEDISAVVSVLDIGFLVSRFEGFGNTLLEYLSAGVPQIASDEGGIPEVVQNVKTGFLISPEDDSEMVEKFELLVTDYQLREQMALASRKRFEECFTVDQFVEAFLEKIII